MYQVDKSKILSIELVKSKTITNIEYRLEKKFLFYKNQPEGWYDVNNDNFLFKSHNYYFEGKPAKKPLVIIIFVDNKTQYIKCDNDLEALELFNNITSEDKTLKK
jgi:hypothetical protein